MEVGDEGEDTVYLELISLPAERGARGKGKIERGEGGEGGERGKEEQKSEGRDEGKVSDGYTRVSSITNEEIADLRRQQQRYLNTLSTRY